MHYIYQGVLKTRAVKNCERKNLSHAQTPDKESSVEEIDKGSVESDQKVGPAKSWLRTPSQMDVAPCCVKFRSETKSYVLDF